MIRYYFTKLVLRLWLWSGFNLWKVVAYYVPNERMEVKGVMWAQSEFDLKQMVFQFVNQQEEENNANP